VFVSANKSIAGLSFYGIMFCIFIFCQPQRLTAQDTVPLQEVQISVDKFSISQLGKRSETIDSTIKAQFIFQSVSEILSFNSAVFIKNYGPGSIATTAFRGGNASQTAILWNGFNIQNTMLGQNDLSLFPAVLFDQMEVEYGGSSSLWGTNAVGGSILLNNKTLFSKGISVTTQIGGGSFGRKNIGANITFSEKRFTSSTKFFLNAARNDYNYINNQNSESRIQKMKHAEYEMRTLLQEFRFLINSKQVLSLNVWVSDNTRNLPSFNQSIDGKTSQSDQAIRLAAKWNFAGKKLNTSVNAAMFYEGLQYNDSLIQSYSKSKVYTTIIESENSVTWHRHILNFGLNVTSSTANSDSYSEQKNLHRASFLAGNKFSFLNKTLQVHTGIRVEYFSIGTLPLTWNISAKQNLKNNFSISTNIAKVYRQPTLNELYWQPSGNINLKPEEGYTYEGSLNYNKKIKKIEVQISASIFSRKIDNWILWIPGANANPSPMNVQQVWSRGTETSWKILYQHQKFSVATSVITSYVLSTVTKNSLENSETLHRQLIYTPRYSVNANVVLSVNKFQLFFFHQYMGYRFISSDNLHWLDPIHTSSVKLSYTKNLKRIVTTFFASTNNLFNADYSIMAGRPMPLRNYEVGINLRIQKPKTIN